MRFLKNNGFEYLLIVLTVGAFTYVNLDDSSSFAEYELASTNKNPRSETSPVVSIVKKAVAAPAKSVTTSPVSSSPAQKVVEKPALETPKVEVEDAIEKIAKANDEVAKIGTQEDMSCVCKFGDVENVIKYETAAQCGKERTYYDVNINALKKIDTNGYYTKNRAPANNVLPKKCSTYIMKSFWKDKAKTPKEKLAADIEWNKTALDTEKREVKKLSEYSDDPHLFSTCPKKNGAPVRHPHKPCVTEEYVNIVHNSILDVADCMGMPAKFMAPKLANESGMHPNAFALGADAGIGQFTSPAIAEVAQNYDNFKATFDLSKESCRRLNSIPGVIPKSRSEILTEDKNRCYMIEAPENPMRSLVFYGIFYKAIKRLSDASWNNKDIDGLLKKAKISNLDKAKIKEMLFVMAYNSGPGQPSSYFAEWLKYRIANLKKYPITKADFDLTYWPKKELFKMKRGDTRAKAMKKGRPLSMPEYIFAYKDSIYMGLVKAQARKLDKGMGDFVCTEQKFLEL